MSDDPLNDEPPREVYGNDTDPTPSDPSGALVEVPPLEDQDGDES